MCMSSVQEFLTATVFLGKLQRRENLMAAFQHFDNDDSGFISEEELLQVLGLGTRLAGAAAVVLLTERAHHSVLVVVLCFCRLFSRRACHRRPLSLSWKTVTGTTTGGAQHSIRQPMPAVLCSGQHSCSSMSGAC